MEILFAEKANKQRFLEPTVRLLGSIEGEGKRKKKAMLKHVSLILGVVV